MANQIKKLISADGSINFVISHAKSFIEARYVQRSPHYISTYVSSHNGCKMGCKFCWLTAQQQTQFKHVDMSGYMFQLKTVLANIPKQQLCNSDIRINVNFMGRGEAMANKTVRKEYPALYDNLENIVKNHGFKEIKMNISTIMPNSLNNAILSDIFRDKPVNIYYSLYTVNDEIKKQLMPNAMDWRKTLDKLAEFQLAFPQNNVVFHGAFMKDINDSDESIKSMVDEIKKRPFLKTKFNLVRFNPPKNSTLKETDESRLKAIFEYISSQMNDDKMHKKSTIIERVGYDAYISCGMFPNDMDL